MIMMVLLLVVTVLIAAASTTPSPTTTTVLAASATAETSSRSLRFPLGHNYRKPYHQGTTAAAKTAYVMSKGREREEQRPPPPPLTTTRRRKGGVGSGDRSVDGNAASTKTLAFVLPMSQPAMSLSSSLSSSFTMTTTTTITTIVCPSHTRRILPTMLRRRTSRRKTTLTLTKTRQHYYSLSQQQNDDDEGNYIEMYDEEHQLLGVLIDDEEEDYECSATSFSTTQLATTSLGTLTNVSSISFGTLNLPIGGGSSNGGINGYPDYSGMNTVIQLLENLPNNTLIDTAQTYIKGNAEEILGGAAEQVLDKDPSKKFFWSTKFGPQLTYPFDGRNANAVTTKCHESIQKLNVDAIDLYQLHYSDTIIPIVKLNFDTCRDVELWDGLIKCYKLGLARNIGVCNYGPKLIKEAYEYITMKHGVPLVSNQISYNLMRFGGATKETKEICDTLGIKVLCYSPLMKGLLSGKYNYDNDDDDSTLPEGQDQRDKYDRFQSCLKRSQHLQDTLQQISRNKSKSIASISYKWIIQKDNTIPIAAIRNPYSIQQWNDLYDGLDNSWCLTQEEMDQLDDVATNDVSPTKEFKLI